jgi:hypothetical protein
VGEAVVIFGFFLSFCYIVYLVLGLSMLAGKGWPIRAGLVMLVTSLLPLVPFLATGERLGPGFGMFVVVLFPFFAVAILTILGGIIAWCVRTVHRSRARPTVSHN